MYVALAVILGYISGFAFGFFVAWLGMQAVHKVTKPLPPIDYEKVALHNSDEAIANYEYQREMEEKQRARRSGPGNTRSS